MPDDLISVLQFTNSTVRAGVEEQILMLLRGLDRRRFKLSFVCPAELANKMRADIPSDVKVIPLCLEWPTQLAGMMRFIRILRGDRIDVLHSHAFASSMVASPIGWLCRVPLIIESAHGREAWRKGWKAKCHLDRFVGRFVDHYTAVSAANAEYLIETKRYPERKITVIHPGCNLAKFAAVYQPPVGLKESFGFHSKDPLLVVTGRIEPQKGHRILLDAMPAIRREFPRVRLVCVGEGSLRSELEEYARRLALDDAVRFVGYWPDVRDWLAIADLTLLPSFHEGLPVTPVESLAAGCAVVTTAVDGTPEVVVHEKTGLTVPPGDPEALAAAVCRLLGSPALRRRLALTGREWVLDRFRSERMVERMHDLYLTTEAGRGREFGRHGACPQTLGGRESAIAKTQ
jgi:glycosyltransferase involved in cell wall biosynthesis